MGTYVIPVPPLAGQTSAGIQKEKNGFRIKCGMTKMDCFAAPSVPLRMTIEGSGRIYAMVERKTSSLPSPKRGRIYSKVDFLSS